MIIQMKLNHTNKNILKNYLLFYLILWGVTPVLFLSSIFPDTAQNFAWSHVIAWGYNEHPPLGALLLHLANQVFHNKVFSAYFSSALCLTISLYLTYKISVLYLTEESAIAATILSSLSYFYICNFVMQYNQNTVMLPLWMASILSFLYCLESNKRAYWILLAFIAACSMLAKYESGIIIMAECAYLFIFTQFKKYAINFLVALILFLVFLTPHIIWIFQSHFITIHHALRGYNHFTPWIKRHALYPLEAFFVPILNFAVAFLTMLFMVKMKWGSIQFDKNIIKLKNPLVFFSCIPLLIVCIISGLMGIHIRAEWCFPLLSLFIPGLFLFLKIAIDNIIQIIIVAFSLQAAIYTVYFCYEYYSPHNKNHVAHIQHPGKSITLSAEKMVLKNGLQINDIKFVGGYAQEEYFYLDAYYPGHPMLLADNSLKESPWIDKQIFLKSIGILIYSGCNPSEKNLEQYHVISKKCVTVDALFSSRKTKIAYTLYLVQPISTERL